MRTKNTILAVLAASIVALAAVPAGAAPESVDDGVEAYERGDHRWAGSTTAFASDHR